MAESIIQAQLVSNQHLNLEYERIAQVALHLFTFELPDKEQQLSPQLGKDLDTFTLFPELPLEVRLRIWRDAFPGPRFVHLGPLPIDFEEPFPREYNINYSRVKYFGSPPITLRINPESRAETLRFYSVILRNQGV
jgi:hypothetical protein